MVKNRAKSSALILGLARVTAWRFMATSKFSLSGPSASVGCNLMDAV
jgi:hypothetical protein